MTVLILILMLLSVNTLMVVRILTTESITEIKDQIDVSLYFNAEATDEEIAEIRNYIGSFPEVEKEVFLDREEVMESFKNNYADNSEILASLEELNENPLGPTLVLKTREPEDYRKIIEAISVPEYENIIEAKTFGDTELAIDRIESITSQVENFSLFLSLLFGVIGFIIIFNTVRVAIYTQRLEIGIKRLVGATNFFISGPYLMESLIFSLISTSIALFLAYLSVGILDPYIAVIFGREDILTNYFFSNIILLFGLQFLAVLLLTVFSSALAMRRYLRV